MKTLFSISITLLILACSCEIMPRNTLKDCQAQCKGSTKSKACLEFCDCIHKKGQPLDKCLEEYDGAQVDTKGVSGP